MFFWDDHLLSWEPRKEKIGDPERRNLANGAEQQCEVRKSGAQLQSDCGKSPRSELEGRLRGCPDAGLKKKRKKVRDNG